MPQNAYVLLAKIGFDTVEKEPCKVWPAHEAAAGRHEPQLLGLEVRRGARGDEPGSARGGQDGLRGGRTARSRSERRLLLSIIIFFYRATG